VIHATAFLLASQPADWVLFFGHFHPLIVHLPIGFLLIAGLLEAGRRLGWLAVSQPVVGTVLFWSAVGATLACIFGYMLSLGGGYEPELLEEHQWQGIGVAVFAWVAWAAQTVWLMNRLPLGSLLYWPALFFSILLMNVAGHHGGALTHGEDYLTQYTPEPFRGWAGIAPRTDATVAAKPITDINQALVYEQIVNPILQSKCVQCHNAGKSKGGLRYDTAERLLKGGENGPVFVAGNAAQSEMVKRCFLPLEDDHHMPPKGKNQTTDEQVALLTWWINQGAPIDKKVADLTITDEVKPALASLGGGAAAGQPGTGTSPITAPSPRPESPVLRMKLPAANPAAIAELKKLGLLVLPLSKELNQLEISAVNARLFNDAQAALLPKLADQVVWLKLGDTQITDATMAQIGKLKNLQKLHLEQTKITDAGLKQLAALPYLEYLNLYGTGITDAGLQSLSGFKNLQTVYLWQTRVTEAGLAAQRKAMPGVEFVGGSITAIQ
jgi:mono/diheme cytochrome c family protein/uncharacterized membrane protein